MIYEKFLNLNTNSINYQSGYNSGISYADGRVNTSSSSYTTGYNNGKNIISTLTSGELVLMLFFNNPEYLKYIDGTKLEYDSAYLDLSRISSITIHTDSIGWSGAHFNIYFGGTQLEYVGFDSEVTINNGHANNSLSVVDQNGNRRRYTIKSFTTTDGKVHSADNLNY